jgi:hypothetical protein
MNRGSDHSNWRLDPMRESLRGNNNDEPMTADDQRRHLPKMRLLKH